MPTFLLASTSDYGTVSVSGLLDAGFTCAGVITSTPRLTGRHRTPTPTPAAAWADTHHFPTFLVNQKITPDLQPQLPACDWLIVADFGYYLPSWLINFPRQLAVNIHPSRLPAYRGASPGQAVILHGDSTSAVSFITLAAQMDAGDLLAQIDFAVAPTWTTPDYYHFAFGLAAKHLPQLLTDYAHDKITLQPQVGTPTYAPKITKQDAFINFATLFDPTLATAHERAIRAYQPWPLAWTIVPTAKGQKRLQLLSAHLQDNQLVLDQVRLEGETAKPWSSVQSKILNT